MDLEEEERKVGKEVVVAGAGGVINASFRSQECGNGGRLGRVLLSGWWCRKVTCGNKRSA